MDEKELKTKLAEMDAAIKVKAGEVEDAELERNCKHERTYQRSCMGREVDTYCDICGECL